MQSHVQELASRIDPKKVYFRQETLCTSLGGNRCPVLTITAMPRSANHSDVQLFRNRPYVFLTARVHPGESNSSWVMHGILNFLLGSCPLAQSVQEAFVFKIVPMLNPDGVINGSYRCSLSGDDLNRQWNNPSLILHPIIYHTKGLLQYLSNLHHTPLVFCDFHGHSRKKNIFLYGCSLNETLLQSKSKYQSSDMCEDRAYRVSVLFVKCHVM
uniref:Peptidase M14 domain-containing protein n=1 Tax=Eptatretus burgeri TaxID=7764 RepID=A0A8C4Q5P4_EPTBU